MRRFKVVVASREGVGIHEPVDARDVDEELRKIGLEWRTADWAHDQPVSIVVLPVREIEDEGRYVVVTTVDSMQREGEFMEADEQVVVLRGGTGSMMRVPWEQVRTLEFT